MSRTRTAIWITCPTCGRKLHIEHAVANCIAFGSKNSAMLLRRV